MDRVNVIENFFGVYLLININDDKKHKGKAYVGFTNNPERRVVQHNRGNKFGGAKKTSRTPGPWNMVMIIHDFPDNISALRFEWAWQQPKASRRLKTIESIQRKKPSESHFQYHFRILTEMINIPPWNRLPLKVRWLDQDYVTSFPANCFPVHMQVCHGAVRALRKRLSNIQQNKEMLEALVTRRECHICMGDIENLKEDRVLCVNPRCKLVAHRNCLAKMILEPGHYVPIQGTCVLCNCKFLWNDVIRKKNGFSIATEELEDDDDLL